MYSYVSIYFHLNVNYCNPCMSDFKRDSQTLPTIKHTHLI